jgi:hypothetical protein
MSDDLREGLDSAIGESTVEVNQSPGGDEPESAPEPLAPHERWPEAVKQRFGKADRDWQTFLLEREKQYSHGINQITGKYTPIQKNWDRIQEVIGPHRQTFQMMGMDDIGAIQYLTNLHAAIQSNPQQGLQWLAQRFGVDLQQLAAPGQAQGSPEVQALQTQLQEMRQQLKQFGSQYSSNQLQTLETQIGDLFQAKDEKGQPRFPFIDDVVQDMVVFIKGKRASGESVSVQSLQDIYDRAVHANPVTRARLSETAARKADDDRKRKADQARRAGFDVQGQGGAKLAPSHSSVRADIEAAWPS